MNYERRPRRLERRRWVLWDRLDILGWALTFIWAGMVLVAHLTGFGSDYSWWDGWRVFFTGAGTITLLGTIGRVLIPEYRYKWVASLIWGLILLSIGLGDSLGWGWIWVGVLIATGAWILGKTLRQARS